MTQLEERNGWHVVAEGGLPDTTRDVWMATRGDIDLDGTEWPLLHAAYRNADGFFWSTDHTPVRDALLWHEIGRPEIPQALRESMEVVER